MTLTERDHTRLNGVHPRLVAVVLRAAEITPVPFMVVQGLRSDEQAYINYGKGRTVAELQAAGVPDAPRYAAPTLAKVTWLRNPLASKHLKQADGYGHAVDLLPAPYDYKNPEDFARLAGFVQKAAAELSERVTWGGTWKTPDRPHFEWSAQ